MLENRLHSLFRYQGANINDAVVDRTTVCLHISFIYIRPKMLFWLLVRQSLGSKINPKKREENAGCWMLDFEEKAGRPVQIVPWAGSGPLKFLSITAIRYVIIILYNTVSLS